MQHLPAGYLHHLFLVYMYLQMWHLPSLPHNLLLSFYIFATYLDTLRAEISPGFNPFFRPLDQQEKQIFNLSQVLRKAHIRFISSAA